MSKKRRLTEAEKQTFHDEQMAALEDLYRGRGYSIEITVFDETDNDGNPVLLIKVGDPGAFSKG